MSDQNQKRTTILRQKQVQARTGLSRSTIYLRISEGNFPKQISLGGRAVGWLDEEVNSWLESQINRSRGTACSRPGAEGQ
jgi:prophage regulatory protein